MSSSRPRSYNALRHRDYRVLWLAEIASMSGSQMMRVAIAWQIFELTRNPLNLGYLGLARFVPLVLFGLWGGVIADRGDRRRTLMVAQLLLMLTSLALVGLTVTGTITAPAIYLLTALSATFGAVANPTRQSLIPAIVPLRDLPGAMAMNGLAFQVGGVLGPALGGILIGLFGVVPLYVFDAVTFLLVAIALATMRSRPVIPDSLSRGMQAVKEGLRFLWATPILLGIMVLDFVATFFGFNSVLMPIFADEVLGGGPQTLGLLLAAPAIGAVVGSTVMAGIRLPDRAGRGVLLAIAVYGVCILGFGLSTVLVVSLLFLAGSGAADAVSMAFRHTIRNEVTPSDLRGRIAAAYSTFAIGGPQLGEFEAGVLAALIGAPMAVAVGGIGVLASVATVWLKVPTIARYSTWKDETLLEAAIEPEK